MRRHYPLHWSQNQAEVAIVRIAAPEMGFASVSGSYSGVNIWELPQFSDTMQRRISLDA